MRPRAGAGQDWLGLGNAQLASGSPIVSALGDELLFYFGYGAASGHHGVQSAEGVYDHYDEGTGVARLRRDGFASMRPPAPRHGSPSDVATGLLTTRPLLFNGSRLFLNVVLGSSLARLRVDVLGPHKCSRAAPVAPGARHHARDACISLSDTHFWVVCLFVTLFRFGFFECPW